jgi:hypothetical protein
MSINNRNVLNYISNVFIFEKYIFFNVFEQIKNLYFNGNYIAL